MISEYDEIAWDKFERTLIIGNSGSGKSWLAPKVAEAFGSKAVDLDAIHWETGGYGVARNKQVAIGMVCQEASGAAWVIEGVFGWLAQTAMPRASSLIWLDMPIGGCLDNIRHRGLRRGGDAASLKALLDWAGNYEERQTSSSHAGHLRMLNDFPLQKLRLSSRDAVARSSRNLVPVGPLRVGCRDSLPGQELPPPGVEGILSCLARAMAQAVRE